MKIDRDTYYKIRKEHTDYLGERAFRFNMYSEKVIQVCTTTGDVKKGKSNTFGIYLIHRLTFLTNYLAQEYAVPCSKHEYQKRFDKVVKMLR